MSQNQNTPPSDVLLQLEEVEKIVCMRRSSIYARMQADEFPRPLQIGPRCVRWREREVREWIDSLPRTQPRKRAS